ncbi:cytochrome P450, family 82, subfamily C, polypeptide 4 [Hibiscus trionum]|uniref:Cytochrome P450, family 82, subfamily C, polypeptide 4 n=1 Tax=Hibiscus trionum TaxID=183268 RepID=A0A9W7M9R9_HIBTR|nr:cytochrome P450, family 82, subfamily C, polypeptide 4 [Hibiscus trionum]
MEILFPFSVTGMVGIFAFLLFSYMLFTAVVRQKSSNNKKNPPEISGGRPFLGHLHLLGGPKPAHITLGNFADEYGPIFTVRLGVHPTLVVSNSEVAKECFTTNDKAFAGRPRSLAAEILGFNFAMFGFSTYGPYWRHVRKIATLEILSNRRLEKLKHVRESETKESIKRLYELVSKNNGPKPVVVEMKRWFWTLNINTVFKMVIGKRYSEVESSHGEDENERRRKAIRDFFNLTGTFTVADSLPFLRWLDLGGHEKAMKETVEKLNQILEECLVEHKRKRNSGKPEGEHDDFMDMMLLLLEDAGNLPSYDADTINKATCLAIILGGTDTSTVTLTWALSLLLNHREALKKAQHELDTCVGKDRLVQESDIKNLVYLQAIIKETTRLYPAAPLSVPHESLEDCTTGGYFIPSGTRLLVNISKLQRDPKVWSDPDEFRPERFLTTHKHIDVRGQNFEFIPFGSGRRVCPGISLALQVLHLNLAALLHSFEITTPLDEPVDMREGAGLTNLKDAPLDVVFTPRLPPHLFE